MLIISRNFQTIRLLQKIVLPFSRCTRSIGDVAKSNDVNIFDLFHTKKLQKERAAQR